MTQLKLFEESEGIKRESHYDLDLLGFQYEHHKQIKNKQIKNKQIKNSTPITKAQKELLDLEEKIISEWADLRTNCQETEKKYLNIKKYEQSQPEEKRAYLQRNHPKFREQGKQTITEYTDSKIFGLFNGFIKSYEIKFKKSKETLTKFSEQHKQILEKYKL